MHKRLSNMPGRPSISNCGISREKILEILKKPYLKETTDFLDNLNEIRCYIRRSNSSY